MAGLLEKIPEKDCNEEINDLKQILVSSNKKNCNNYNDNYNNDTKRETLYKSGNNLHEIIEDLFHLLIDQMKHWVKLSSYHRPDNAIAKAIKINHLLHINIQTINSQFNWNNWIEDFIEENRRLRRLKRILIEANILSKNGKKLL